MLAELRITPVGFRTEFARLVADVVAVIAKSNLQYQVNAMGTLLEGELEEILQVVRGCHREVRRHTDRVLIELSIDDHEAAEGELVRSIERTRQVGLGAPIERVVHPKAR